MGTIEEINGRGLLLKDDQELCEINCYVTIWKQDTSHSDPVFGGTSTVRSSQPGGEIKAVRISGTLPTSFDNKNPYTIRLNDGREMSASWEYTDKQGELAVFKATGPIQYPEGYSP